MFSAKKIKADFPIFSQKIYGKDLVYLDNAATTQKPLKVLEEMDLFYKNYNANIHRGVYFLSEKATMKYEESREIIAKFIGAKDSREIIFTKNATESLNLVASILSRSYLKKGDKVLLSSGEHHSNIIPWQLNLPLVGAEIDYLNLDSEGRIDELDLEKKIVSGVKVVSIAYASNSSGVIHNIEKIVKLAKKIGALVVLDACQAVPHLPINVSKIGCDFLAFSGHKMLGPTGIGVLYGRKDLLDNLEPYQGGGGMIAEVTKKGSSWAEVPEKYEAGTPNICGAIGLATACLYLENIGMKEIFEHEMALTAKALEVLQKNPEVIIYGPKNLENRLGIISFGLKNIHPHDIATILDTSGIAIRAGHHCSQMMMQNWGASATARLSFYLYNTEEDIEYFGKTLTSCQNILGL